MLRGKLFPGQGADGLLGDRAVLEAGDGRNARYSVVHCGGRVIIHVYLDELHIIAVFAHLVQDRRDTPARYAPRRPEVHYYRLLRLQDLVLERGVRNLGNRHKPHLQNYAKSSTTRSVYHAPYGHQLSAVSPALIPVLLAVRKILAPPGGLDPICDAAALRFWLPSCFC